MSRYNTKYPAGTVTVAKLWTKHVIEILKNLHFPCSTFDLLTRFAARAIAMNLFKPGTGERLSPPDVSYLEWMANKGIIKKHDFDNRRSEYWSYGLNITYPNMNDDPAMDQVAIPSHLQPSEKSSPQTTGKAVTSSKRKFKSRGDTPVDDPEKTSEEEPIWGSKWNGEISTVHPANEFGILNAIERLGKVYSRLVKLTDEQGKEIETLKHKISELEIKEGIDRTKPKTSKIKTEFKLGAVIASDIHRDGRISSIRNYRVRIEKSTGQTPALKESMRLIDEYMSKNGVPKN